MSDTTQLSQEKVPGVASPVIEVVIDRMILPYLTNATIDHVDTLPQQGFTVDNPNGACACADSFH